MQNDQALVPSPKNKMKSRQDRLHGNSGRKKNPNAQQLRNSHLDTVVGDQTRPGKSVTARTEMTKRMFLYDYDDPIPTTVHNPLFYGACLR